MKQYKNRKALFNRLHDIHKIIEEMILNNQHLLEGGIETILLKSANEKIRTVTRSKQRRENKG